MARVSRPQRGCRSRRDTRSPSCCRLAGRRRRVFAGAAAGIIVAEILCCARIRGASVDWSIDRSVGWLLFQDVLLKFSLRFPSCFSLPISILLPSVYVALIMKAPFVGRGRGMLQKSGGLGFRVCLQHERGCVISFLFSFKIKKYLYPFLSFFEFNNYPFLKRELSLVHHWLWLIILLIGCRTRSEHNSNFKMSIPYMNLFDFINSSMKW